MFCRFSHRLCFSRRELPFTKTAHLSNPWNEHKPVKIGRDGQVSSLHFFFFCCFFFFFFSCIKLLFSFFFVQYLSGDPTGHRRSALCPVPIGRECGYPPGGSSCSSQASDAVRAPASGSTATTRTGKVSQSPSYSSRFLFFFYCCDHGATRCWMTETAALFSRWLAFGG